MHARRAARGGSDDDVVPPRRSFATCARCLECFSRTCLAPKAKLRFMSSSREDGFYLVCNVPWELQPYAGQERPRSNRSVC